jgi:hypothetical protein
MRTLKFIVEDQIVKMDPDCDFSGIVPGTEGYLQAEFSFSYEWSDCVKVAGFFSTLGREYPPQILKDGRTCIIPKEALEKRSFKVQVVGGRKDYKIVTNRLTVKQDGGVY